MDGVAGSARGGGGDEAEQRRSEKRARKRAAREAKRRKQEEALQGKPCDLCGAMCAKLFRCQIDASGRWRFVCPDCWPSVSGGVTDGNVATHPHYRYGGTWKLFKR